MGQRQQNHIGSGALRREHDFFCWQVWSEVNYPKTCSGCENGCRKNSELVKVMPSEYRKILAKAHLGGDAAKLASI